ncbi:hypothetical protein PG984_012931 [Apiospora sp. TS-2023a]
MTKPTDILFEILGSPTMKKGFFLVERGINTRKAKCLGLVSPFAGKTFSNALTTAIETGKGEANFLQPIRESIGAWQYMATQVVSKAIWDKRLNLYRAILFISSHATDRSLASMFEIFLEFDIDYWQLAATNCKDTLAQYIQDVHNNYTEYMEENPTTVPANWFRVRDTLDQYEIALDVIKAPPAPWNQRTD